MPTPSKHQPFLPCLVLLVVVLLVVLPCGCQGQGMNFTNSTNSTTSNLNLNVTTTSNSSTSKVERYQEGIDYRTNVCHRQALVSMGNMSVDQALRGLNLSVAISHYTEPIEDTFFNLDQDGNIKEEDPGLFVIIMDELARRAGFSWRDNFAAIEPVPPARTKDNRTQSELLEWEINHFDIAVDNWAKTVPRMKRGIAFPEGWFDSSLILVERTTPKGDVNMWSFLTPFQFSVWVMIAVAIVATGIMYWIMEMLNGNADEGKLDNKPLATIFMSALTFTGNFNFQPNTPAAKLISFSWTFWTLVVASSYTANLASFLVARRTPDFKIRSIEQAVRFEVPVCVHGSSNQDELLNESFSDLLLVRKRLERNVFEGLINEECRVAVVPVSSFEMYVRSNLVNADCSIQSDKRVIEILSGGLATAIDSGVYCTSLIDNVLGLYMTQMKADGWIDDAWNQHLVRNGDLNCNAKDDDDTDASDLFQGDLETTSLSLEEMAGIFILHGMAATIALVVALIRFFVVKRKNPQELIERLGLKGEEQQQQQQHQQQSSTASPTTTEHPMELPNNAPPQQSTSRPSLMPMPNSTRRPKPDLLKNLSFARPNRRSINKVPEPPEPQQMEEELEIRGPNAYWEEEERRKASW